MSKNISKAHNPNPVGMSAIVTADTKERSGNMNPNFDIDLLEDLYKDWMFPVENGFLDQKGEDWSPRLHKEKGKLEDCHRLHVAYDQNAKAKYFVPFLKVLCQDDENDEGWRRKAWLILEAIGYILLPSCKSRKVFLLFGNDMEGKEAVLKIICTLTGREYAPIVWPTPSARRNEALKAKCFVMAAHPPIGKNESKDFFRRLIVIPMINENWKRGVDEYLEGKLKTELPGILNLILKALSRLKKRGRFSEPESCQELKKEIQLEAEQLAAFTEDCCDIRPWDKETTKQLYEVYQRWAYRTGSEPLDKWVLVLGLSAGYGLKTYRDRTHKNLLPDIRISWS